ncbi:MAG: hypothetical protein JO043_02450 [Candidatus Eremiobacteraeota bacterium]|nr:hypothetical protein [Candidatus Eremiobacteraeota bacterium]
MKAAVYAAVADLNESLSSEQRIPLTGTAAVFAALDSLAALNLLLRIEHRLSEAGGTEYDLTNGDFYETTVFCSPTLDQLVDGVHAAIMVETA